MKRAALAVRPEFIKTGNFRITGGAAAMMELLSLRERPTAILTANNLTAIGGMRAAMKRCSM